MSDTKEKDVITSEDNIKSNAREGVDNTSGETISDKINGSSDILDVPSTHKDWQTPLYYDNWRDSFDFDLRSQISKDTESMSFAPSSDYGDSYYDKYAANREDFEDLNEVRAYQQGYISKTASGVTNWAITTSATLLDDTIGLLYGVGAGVYNVATGKGSFTEGLWNNDFKRGTHDFIKWGQEVAPLYRSKHEQNLGLLESVLTYNFLMDQLSTMGYTSGAIAAAALTAGLGAFSKVSKLAQFLNKSKIGSTLYKAGASYINSMGESAGEAIDAYEEAKSKYTNERKQELEIESQQLESQIQQELQQYRAYLESQRTAMEGQNIDHSNIDYEMSVAEEKIRNKYQNQTNALISKFNSINSEAEQKAKEAANMVLLENIGIIGTSNLIGTFSHLKVPYNNANRNLRGSVTNMFRKKGKEVAEQGWEKFARAGVEMISEGNEEMLQNAAKSAALNYYSSEFNPEQTAGFQRFLEASGEALSSTYTDTQAYKEFLGGAFIGLFGAAGMQKNNEGKLGFKWTGGIFDTFGKEEREARANSQKAYEEINKVYNDPNLQKRLKYIVGTMADKEGMKRALENKNSKEFFDNQDNLLLRTVETFSDLGRLSDLKALVGKEVNMSDEELESFVVNNVEEIKDANGKGTGKFKSDLPLVTNTGELKTNTEEGKKEILDYLQSSQDRANKIINEYEKVIDEEDKRTGWSLTREQLARLANVKIHANLASERLNELWDSMPLKGKYLNTFINNLRTIANEYNIEESFLRNKLDRVSQALNKYKEESELSEAQKESQARLATDVETLNNLLDIAKSNKEAINKNITYGENLASTSIQEEDKEDKEGKKKKSIQVEDEEKDFDFNKTVEGFLKTLDESKGEVAAEMLAMPIATDKKTGKSIYLADVLYDTLQKSQESSDDVVDKINSMLGLRNARKAYDALFREYIKAPERIQEDINKTLEKQNDALIKYLSNDILNNLNAKQTSAEMVNTINSKLDKFDDNVKSKVISELEKNLGIREALMTERYKSKMLQYLQEILNNPEKYPNIDASSINETRKFLESTQLSVQEMCYMTLEELLNNISPMFDIDVAINVADNIQELLNILANEVQEEKSKQIAARQQQQQNTQTSDEESTKSSQSPLDKQEEAVYKEIADNLVKDLINTRRTGNNAEKYAGKSDAEIKSALIESANALIEKITGKEPPYGLWQHQNSQDVNKTVEGALKHIGQLNRYKCLFYGDSKMTDIINNVINNMISYINEYQLLPNALPQVQALSTKSDEDLKTLQDNYPNIKIVTEQSESIPKGTNFISKANLDKNEIVVLSGNKKVEEAPVNTPKTTEEEAILGIDPPVTPIIDNQEENKETSLENTQKKLEALRERFGKFVFFEKQSHSYYIYIGDSAKEAKELADNNDFENDKFVKADFSASSFKYGPSRVRTNDKLQLAQEDGNAYDEIIRNFFQNKSLEETLGSVDGASEKTIKDIYDICEKDVKPELLKRYGKNAVIITDSIEMAAMATKDDKTGVIAGIPDMVIIDDKGKIHILDFKAKVLTDLISAENPNENTDKNTGKSRNDYDAYRNQLTVYGSILEANGLPVKHDIQLIQFNTTTYDKEGQRVPVLVGFAPLSWDNEVNISKLDINALRDQKTLSAAPTEADSNLASIEGEIINPVNSSVPVTSQVETPTNDEVLQQTPEEIVQSNAAKNNGTIDNKQYPDVDELTPSNNETQTAYLFSDYHQYDKDKEKNNIFEEEVNPYSAYLVQQGAYDYINSDNIKKGHTVYLKPLDVEAVYNALPEGQREQWYQDYKRDVVSPCMGIYHYSQGEYHLVGILQYDSKYKATTDSGRAMRNRLSLQVLPNDSDLKYGVGNQKDKSNSPSENVRRHRLTQNGKAINQNSKGLANSGYYLNDNGEKEYISIVPSLEKDEEGYFYGKNANGSPLIFGDVLAGKIQTTAKNDDGNYDMTPIRDIKVGEKDFTKALEDGTIQVGVVSSANNSIVLSDIDGNGSVLTDDSCKFAAGSSIVRFRGADGQYKYSSFFGKKVEKEDFNDDSLVKNKFLYDTYHQIDGTLNDGRPCGLVNELVKVSRNQVDIREAKDNITTCLRFILNHTNLALDKANLDYVDGKYYLEFKTINSQNTYRIECSDNKEEIKNAFFNILSQLNARYSLNKGLLLETPIDASGNISSKTTKNKKWYLKGFLDIAETSVVNFETRNNKVVITYAPNESKTIIPENAMNGSDSNKQARTVIHNSLGDIVITFNKARREYVIKDTNGNIINHTELASRLGLSVRDEDKTKLAASIQVFLNKIIAFAEYDMNFTSPKYNIYDGKIIFEATPNTMEMIFDAVNGMFITDRTIQEIKQTAAQIQNPQEEKPKETKQVTNTQVSTVQEGENISSKGSDFAKQLTNYGNNVEVEYKGKVFRNSEHAYQTWKSGKFDETAYNSKAEKPRGSKPVNKKVNYQIMVEIIASKLQQHPELIEGINQRGGLSYLQNSTHNVVGDSYWESNGQNKFIEALTEAYQMVTRGQETQVSTSEPTQTTEQTASNEGMLTRSKKGRLRITRPKEDERRSILNFDTTSNHLFNAGVGEYNAINILKGIDSDISRLLQSVLPKTSTIVVLSDKEFDEKFGKNINGAYVTNDNVYVRKSAHNDTIIHELVHKVVPSLLQDEDAAEVLKEQFKSYKLYLEVHPELKNKVASKNVTAEYAATDIHEFLAEIFSNEEVVKILQSIPSDYTVLNTETSKYEVNPKYRENIDTENDTKLLEEAKKESILAKIIKSIVRFFTKKAVEKHVILPKNAYDVASKAGKDLIKAFNKVNHIDNREFKESTASNSLNDEMQSIKDKAIADGTFMKAPNGKPTNLNERQWLQVRTKAFKEWFGDWENPTIFTANNVDNVEELMEKYPSELPNKFYHHSTNKFGKQAFDSREGTKEKLHIIGRLTTDKVDVLVVENPNSDNKISHITLATAEGVKPFESNKELENNQDKIQPLDDYVGTTFTNNLRSDVSKVVDENGEPLVVYHSNTLDKNYKTVSQIVPNFELDSKPGRYQVGVSYADFNKLSDKDVATLLSYNYVEFYRDYLIVTEAHFGTTEDRLNAFEVDKRSLKRLRKFHPEMTVRDIENISIPDMVNPFINNIVTTDITSDDEELWQQALNNPKYEGRAKTYFTDKKNLKYSNNFGRATAAVFLNIKHPFDYDNATKQEKENYFRNDFGSNNIKGIKLLRDGYDGATAYLTTRPEYVPFTPNQIKSATDNVGTFSRENNDIRYERRTTKEFNNKINRITNDYNPKNSIFVNENLVKINNAGKLQDVIRTAIAYTSDKSHDNTKALLKELMPLIRQQDYTKEELEQDLDNFYDTLYGYKHSTFYDNLIDMVNMLSNPMYSLPLIKGSNTNKQANYRYIENVNDTVTKSIEEKC